ncbi:hypothetical protein [Clostridium sp.]|nr:hypothetical protein [Clostridium sp.]
MKKWTIHETAFTKKVKMNSGEYEIVLKFEDVKVLELIELTLY